MFDKATALRGLGTTKWDLTQAAFGTDDPEALPMWIADGDYAPPSFVTDAMQALIDRGHYGYFCHLDGYREAVAWWMQTRHGWTIDPGKVLTTHGLGNAIGLTLQTFTDPGDEVIVFSPVYLEFFKKIKTNRRKVLQSPLVKDKDGLFVMDLEALDQAITPRSKMVLLCSPHNPGGRVWSLEELTQLAEFCERHDLLLVSDEIHCDLVLPGHKHHVLSQAVPGIRHRLITLTAASKTFSTAGLRTGQVIVEDDTLWAKMDGAIKALDIQPNLVGMTVTQAAFSPQGAAYADAKVAYIADNAARLENVIADIPGASFMPMQSTYLAWVDFADTGMAFDELRARIIGQAKVLASPGPDFGAGGETCFRFNLATQRAQIDTAGARLRAAFSDLQ